MTYQITARKWRPRDFDAVVGQKHVTQTLKNAIISGRIAQSYLFSGPRGVGKTTMARILVKALNCEKGPTVSPCHECSFCRDIAEGKSLDYVEIDGASNRGIDQIREITESLKYASPDDKHRVFVIDEVHMLTVEAFNALLKTLEEPPERIIFIFCTTEPHRVPATIRSRCQHHCFRAFNIATIGSHLKEILNQEKIPHTEKALFYISRAAQGSMRDGQSVLDQVVAYADGEVNEEVTLEVLGLSSIDIHREFLINLTGDRKVENHHLFTSLLGEGKDMRQFIYEIIDRLNALILVKEGVDEAGAMDLDREEFESLKDIARSFRLSHLYTLTDICFDLLKELKHTTHPKVLLDLYLIKLHRYRNLITPEQLKSELLKISAGIDNPSEQSSPSRPPSSPEVEASSFSPDNEDKKADRERPPDTDSSDSMKKNPVIESPPSSRISLENKKPLPDKKPIAAKSPNIESEEVNHLIKQIDPEAPVEFVAFGGQSLTLQQKKTIPHDRLISLKQALHRKISEQYRFQIKVNVLEAGIDPEVKGSVHNAISMFNGEIVN